jgi:integrase/recombinase XerD
VKGGLRSKEISGVKWSMMVSPADELTDSIHLTNDVSKGKSGGRIIPIHKGLKKLLVELYELEQSRYGFDVQSSHVVRSERSPNTSSQSIIEMFPRWYRDLGFVGCSSHSGRRTSITDLSKKVSLVDGSLRDIHVLVGYKNLQTTQRYIEVDTDCQREIVNLI